MQCVTRPRITELNPHLLCVLCGGYYVDATAIIECLHSFCKSCIVRYLETHKYCPICDVLVHKSKPLQNIRPDKILQSIVYKLVPNLYEKEMCNRRSFYLQIQSNHRPVNSELRGEITEASDFFTAKDTINLSLEYINFLGDQNYFYVASSSKRYLKCQASVTIRNLKKLISAKYSLATKHEIRFFFNGIQLPEHLTLLDIAYISSWKRKGFIRLLYQILEVRKTIIKLENREPPITLKIENSSENELSSNKNNFDNKTQTSIDQKEKPNDPSTTLESLPQPSLKIETSALTNVAPVTTAITITTSISINPISTPCEVIASTKTNENSTLNKIVQILEKKASNEAINSQKNNKNDSINNKNENIENFVECESECKNTKKLENSVKPELKKKSPNICPISEKYAKLSTDCVVSSNCKDIRISVTATSITSTISTTTSGSNITTSTNSIINNSVTPVFNYSSHKIPKTNSITFSKVNTEAKLYKNVTPSENKPTSLPQIIKKPTKTLKTFTRPWNSSTPATTIPNKPNNSDDKTLNQKPVKFFKARNTPRFLGNPASGIRPIYQVSPEKSESDNSKKTKTVSVIKMDPKKLCPITTSAITSSTSVVNKKPFPFMSTSKYPTTMSYSSPSTASSYVNNLPITSSTISGKLPQFPFPSMNHNSLLGSINPLLYGIYPTFQTSDSTVNGPTSLDFMKAMAAFHPSLPPAINSLFNPHHKLKQEKNQKSSKPAPSPPTVQRIPPSNNNSKNDTDKNTSLNLSNGVMKKNKKSEMNSFAINNLIPLDEVKNVTHSCSADGVNQICDQVSDQKKSNNLGDKDMIAGTEKNDQKEVQS